MFFRSWRWLVTALHKPRRVWRPLVWLGKAYAWFLIAHLFVIATLLTLFVLATILNI